MKKRSSNKPSAQVEQYNAKNERDYPEIVLCFHDASRWRVKNALATDGKDWFLCSASGNDEEVPRSNMTAVSLTEAGRWFVQCEPFADGFDGTSARLVEDMVKAIEFGTDMVRELERR